MGKNQFKVNEMGETKRWAKCTLEYKMEAVRLVKGGQAVTVTAKIPGIPKASLDNWVKLSAKGQLKGTGDKPVSPEQMELAHHPWHTTYWVSAPAATLNICDARR
jgi:hypothetical protein